jgi:hypothetical protein
LGKVEKSSCGIPALAATSGAAVVLIASSASIR